MSRNDPMQEERMREKARNGTLIRQLVGMGMARDQARRVAEQVASAQSTLSQPGPLGTNTRGGYVAASPLQHLAKFGQNLKAQNTLDQAYGRPDWGDAGLLERMGRSAIGRIPERTGGAYARLRQQKADARRRFFEEFMNSEEEEETP